MQHDRFSGLRGDEYTFLVRAYPHFDEFQRKIANAVSEHIGDSAKVLEIGTGIGYTLLPLVESLSAKKAVHVYALDISASDLLHAKENIAEYSSQSVAFIAADVFELLPLLESNSFDAICSGWTLHNFTQEQRACIFTHIKRILKDGGICVNGDRFAYDDEMRQSESIAEQLALYREHMPPHLSDAWSAHILEDEKWMFTESEQASYFPNGRFTFRLRNEGVFVAVK